MRILGFGSIGDDVGDWQSFLRGQHLYLYTIDDKFGDKTKNATVRFQNLHKIPATGLVDLSTKLAAEGLGFSISESDFPPIPDFKPLNLNEKLSIFGRFDYQAIGTSTNPEAIKILGSWVQDNIVTVTVPQFKNMKVQFHKKAANQLLELFKAWERENLISKILTWGGAWVPRFVRGSKTTLSNHSYGTAFDINTIWNMLGSKPTPVGGRGSVRELVPIANQYGFYWGGHYPSRPDGMHFEIAKLVK